MNLVKTLTNTIFKHFKSKAIQLLSLYLCILNVIHVRVCVSHI